MIVRNKVYYLRWCNIDDSIVYDVYWVSVAEFCNYSIKSVNLIVVIFDSCIFVFISSCVSVLIQWFPLFLSPRLYSEVSICEEALFWFVPSCFVISFWSIFYSHSKTQIQQVHLKYNFFWIINFFFRWKKKLHNEIQKWVFTCYF